MNRYICIYTHTHTHTHTDIHIYIYIYIYIQKNLENVGGIYSQQARPNSVELLNKSVWDSRI